jgi:hypothetical protein
MKMIGDGGGAKIFDKLECTKIYRLRNLDLKILMKFRSGSYIIS